METEQVLLLKIRVDQTVMTWKRYSKLHRPLEMEPHHRIEFRAITRILIFEVVIHLFWGCRLKCHLSELSTEICIISFGIYTDRSY